MCLSLEVLHQTRWDGITIREAEHNIALMRVRSSVIQRDLNEVTDLRQDNI